MSSSIDIVVQMKLVQTYLYRYGGVVLIFFGTIGCMLNLIVFGQKTLRKNPCSIYFISHNIANFIFIYAATIFLMLNLGYNIDYSIRSLVICRVRLYITILSNFSSPFYLVLASIDRVLITSPNAITRQRSTRRLAYICVIIETLFFILLHSPILFLANIIPIGPNAFICYFQSSIYVAFLSYCSLSRAISALSLMIICGLWSIKNIHNIQKVRPPAILSTTAASTGSTAHSTSSKERQLSFILLIDILIYTLFSFAFAIFLIYQQITQNSYKNAERTQIETVISNICQFSGAIPFCFSCYGNLLVSKTFRNEVKKILSCQLNVSIH